MFTRRGGYWVVGQVVLFAAIAAALAVTGGSWGGIATIIGLSVAVVGGVFAVWAMLALGGNLTPYPTPVPGASLVTRGPYRVVRHPIYGGLVLGAVGLSVADGNPIAVAVSGLLAGWFWAKSAFEEKRLVEAVPGYAQYRTEVRWRLVPWLA